MSASGARPETGRWSPKYGILGISEDERHIFLFHFLTGSYWYVTVVNLVTVLLMTVTGTMVNKITHNISQILTIWLIIYRWCIQNHCSFWLLDEASRRIWLPPAQFTTNAAYLSGGLLDASLRSHAWVEMQLTWHIDMRLTFDMFECWKEKLIQFENYT